MEAAAATEMEAAAMEDTPMAQDGEGIGKASRLGLLLARVSAPPLL